MGVIWRRSGRLKVVNEARWSIGASGGCVYAMRASCPPHAIDLIRVDVNVRKMSEGFFCRGRWWRAGAECLLIVVNR